MKILDHHLVVFYPPAMTPVQIEVRSESEMTTYNYIHDINATHPTPLTPTTPSPISLSQKLLS